MAIVRDEPIVFAGKKSGMLDSAPDSGFVLRKRCPRGLSGQSDGGKGNVVDSAVSVLRRRRCVRGHEAFDTSEDQLPDPDAWLHEVSQVLSAARSRQSESTDEFDANAALLFSHAEQALRRVKRKGWAVVLDADQYGSMEALVALDGSRPSLLLRDGEVDPNDPFLGKWKDHILASASTIRECATSVGRIQAIAPAQIRRFGTGFLIDADAGLVVTAAHVFDRLAVLFPTSSAAGAIRFADGPAIDFRGEIGATDRRLLKIVSGARVAADGPFIDAAVLLIRPFSAQDAAVPDGEIATMPPPLALKPKNFDDPPVSGNFCIIGYPDAPLGEPPAAGAQVDWVNVVERLFGATYGVKRIAPGMALTQPDPWSSDRSERRFRHDATTLGGSSGSPVIGWNDVRHPAFGVHVAGRTLSANYSEWIPGFYERLQRAARSAMTI